METVDYPFDYDEMPLAAKLLKLIFVEDKELFSTFFPVFDDSFVARFSSQIIEADQLICKSPTGVMLQNLRVDIYNNIENLGSQLMIIQDYYKDSKIVEIDYLAELLERKNLRLSIDVASNVIDQLKHHKPESSDQNLEKEIDCFKNMLKLLKLRDIELKKLLSSSGIKSDAVYSCLNDLWATMQDIMEIGYSLYIGSNLSRANDFQLDDLKEKVKSYKLEEQSQQLSIWG